MASPGKIEPVNQGHKPVPGGLLTREQAAARLGVSVRTLFNLRASGHIPDDAECRLPTDRQRVLFDPAVLDRLGDVRAIRTIEAAARRERRQRAGMEDDDEQVPPTSAMKRHPVSGRPIWQ